MPPKPIIERAYELAGSGRYASVGDVERALRVEGYSTFGELAGPALRRQLTSLCRGIDPTQPSPSPRRPARRQTRPRVVG